MLTCRGRGGRRAEVEGVQVIQNEKVAAHDEERVRVEQDLGDDGYAGVPARVAEQVGGEHAEHGHLEPEEHALDAQRLDEHAIEGRVAPIAGHRRAEACRRHVHATRVHATIAPIVDLRRRPWVDLAQPTATRVEQSTTTTTTTTTRRRSRTSTSGQPRAQVLGIATQRDAERHGEVVEPVGEKRAEQRAHHVHDVLAFAHIHVRRHGEARYHEAEVDALECARAHLHQSVDVLGRERLGLHAHPHGALVARVSQRELVEGGYVATTHPHATCRHKAKHKRSAALQRSQQALYEPQS